MLLYVPILLLKHDSQGQFRKAVPMHYFDSRHVIRMSLSPVISFALSLLRNVMMEDCRPSPIWTNVLWGLTIFYSDSLVWFQLGHDDTFRLTQMYPTIHHAGLRNMICTSVRSLFVFTIFFRWKWWGDIVAPVLHEHALWGVTIFLIWFFLYKMNFVVFRSAHLSLSRLGVTSSHWLLQ